MLLITRNKYDNADHTCSVGVKLHNQTVKHTANNCSDTGQQTYVKRYFPIRANANTQLKKLTTAANTAQPTPTQTNGEREVEEDKK